MEGNLPFLVKIPSEFFQLGGGDFGRWVEKVDNGWLAQLQNSGQFNHKFEHQTIPQALYQIKS
jgi:hypothetical protein